MLDAISWLHYKSSIIVSSASEVIRHTCAIQIRYYYYYRISSSLATYKYNIFAINSNHSILRNSFILLFLGCSSGRATRWNCLRLT